jgi:hypothetical protein
MMRISADQEPRSRSTSATAARGCGSRIGHFSPNYFPDWMGALIKHSIARGALLRLLVPGR